jgi:MoaA/NifB/PqqE/SkfB family radical SAM enzyme
MRDLTPFKTRSRLLSGYKTQVEAFRSGGDPFPVQVEVNLCGSCNQTCGWCINANVHDKSRIDLTNPRIPVFFQDFKQLGGRAVGWSGGGEPTNHPKFDKALEMVGDTGLDQGLLTNGAFSDRLVKPIAEHCDWVRVSIDTHDEKIYGRRRRASPQAFRHVLENVKEMVAVGGVRVGLNMNVSEWNRDHIQELFDLARSLKVNYLQVRPTLPTPFEQTETDNYLNPDSIESIIQTLNVVQAHRQPDDPDLIVSEDKFNDLRLPKYGRADPNWGYKGCQSHRLFVVVNYTGDLAVCMYHLDNARFTFGNIYNATLEQIWNSRTRQEVLEFCKDLNHKVLLSAVGKEIDPEAAANAQTGFL